MIHLHQFALLEPINHAAYRGLVNDRGLDDVGQRTAAVVANRAQYHKLCRRELRVGDVVLKERRMPLVNAPQQVTDLVGKAVAVMVGCSGWRICH